jgi:iron transport multicopper oxidase
VYLIEADGVEIEPINLNEEQNGLLTISVAQRYSVLVQAKNETNTNYALRLIGSISTPSASIRYTSCWSKLT